jgi:biopolymer transport protein TolQ
MFVNNFFLASNPFIDAYVQSDWLGKLIFIGLIALSICSWILIGYKGWITHLARKNASSFYQTFEQQRTNPLNLDCDPATPANQLNPFYELYDVLRSQTLEILKKNHHFRQLAAPEAQKSTETVSYMSASDIDYVQSHLSMAVANQTKFLEKNLFMLSTIVSLAPFLGLLGTVWGILTTFSAMQTNASGSTHNMVLGGISLALATTVLGLIDAIPALIGYNYLKNSARDFQTDMEGFSGELLASVEMYYRKVDIS